MKSNAPKKVNARLFLGYLPLFRRSSLESSIFSKICPMMCIYTRAASSVYSLLIIAAIDTLRHIRSTRYLFVGSHRNDGGSGTSKNLAKIVYTSGTCTRECAGYYHLSR